MATRFFTSADGARIAYDVTGQGPALMLLHGLSKTRRDWHKVGYVDRLKDDFAVMTVDIRGTGDSDMLLDVADYAIEKICADLIGVADDCGAQRFLAWGYSFGGNIARYLGAWTDRLNALAVVGIPFGPAVSEEFDKFVAGFVQKWGAMADAHRAGSMPAQEQPSTIKGRMPAIIASLQAMRSWPAIEPGDLHCPLLLLVGTKNARVLKWAQSNREALAAAAAQVEIVEGLNHSQEFSKIDRVYPHVRPFLDRFAGGKG